MIVKTTHPRKVSSVGLDSQAGIWLSLGSLSSAIDFTSVSASLLETTHIQSSLRPLSK